MGRRQAEHHVSVALRQPEQQARQIGGHCLAEGAEEGNHQHHPQYVGALQQHAYVDEHAHTDEEVRYKQGVARKLQAVHQRRHVGDVPVQDKSREEGAENAFQTDEVSKRSIEEHNGQDKDELHHGITVASQEIARQMRDKPQHKPDIGPQLHHEQQPEQPSSPRCRLCSGAAAVAPRQSGNHHQRQKQADHRRPHRKRHRMVPLQAIAADDGIGNERVRGHDTAQQERRRRRVVQQRDGHQVRQSQGHQTRQQSEDEEPLLVLLHALHVHLQSGQEHDVVETDAPEQFERVVALQDVQAVLPHDDARQHHADDVRNPQLAHDDRGKQDNEQHHEEYQRGVGYGEVRSQYRHFGCKVTQKNSFPISHFLFFYYLCSQIHKQ